MRQYIYVMVRLQIEAVDKTMRFFTVSVLTVILFNIFVHNHVDNHLDIILQLAGI
jgi:hypothetical protein